MLSFLGCDRDHTRSIEENHITNPEWVVGIREI